MARRSGLGQRGLDILIPDHSSGKKEIEHSEEKKNSAAKSGKGRKKTEGKIEPKEPKEVKEREEPEQPEETKGSVNEEKGPENLRNGEMEIDIDKVEPNRGQPRKNFDEDSIQELADSIRVHGIIQPLIVQKRDGYYEIIAGERRWRAARLAGLKKVPVLVRDYTDREIMELSLIENIQRQDLNPIEEASAYRQLIEEYSLTQDDVAQRVSKSRAAVTNSLRLLKLDPRVQDMLIREMLTSGHVRALLPIEDGELQYQTAQKAFDEKMSVREVESYVRKLLKKPVQEKKPAVSQQLQTIYRDMEEKMKTSLGTKVSIHSRTSEKGKIEIDYFSSDDLERICHTILTGGENGETV